MKVSSGFTLIELMITVAIIGILAAVAYPAYTDYLIRGRIPDATSALSAKRVQMEQWFQDNRSYDTATPAPACVDDAMTSRFFTFSCDNLTATTYTIVAVGIGPMVGFDYTINQANAKASAITAAGWANPNPNNCWATKRGGQC